MTNETFRSYLCGQRATGNTNYSLWKAKRHIKRPHVQVLPIRKEGGIWARSKQKNLEIYARHLKRVFLPNDTGSELDIVQCQQLNAKLKKI